MKIKKGDLVQVLPRQGPRQEGRVVEARPRERRVLVENVNLIKRHTRPRPIRNASQMGGPQIEPGGVIERRAAARLERDGRLPDVQAADPGRHG